MDYGWLLLIPGVAGLASLPYWLPGRVVGLRNFIFTRINGQDALHFPDGTPGSAREFLRVYRDRRARGRSRGAELSDLFWYWLAPGPEMHQEHLEDGPRYESIARLTLEILGRPRRDVEAMIDASMRESLRLPSRPDSRPLRLRDVVMPLWADFFHRLVFRERGTERELELIRAHANDLVTALKCCGLRHMGVRARLTEHLIDRIEAGALPFEFPAGFSVREQAYYLQGTYFTTGVVQMSDATTHVLLAIAKHADVQERLASDPEDDAYLDSVIAETFRCYPLFGISHRITTDEIPRPGRDPIPKGSVVCFDHQAFQRMNWERPEAFDPGRWSGMTGESSHYIPFGVHSNRSCPAHGLALVGVRHVVRRMVREYRFESSARHTRSNPNRGPCFVRPRPTAVAVRPWRLCLMALRDDWEGVLRSFVQLACGTYMVLDARRLRLCQRHFAEHDPDDPGGVPAATAGAARGTE